MTLSHFSRKSGSQRTYKAIRTGLNKSQKNSIKTLLDDKQSIKTAEIVNKLNEINTFEEAHQTINLTKSASMEGAVDLLGEMIEQVVESPQAEEGKVVNNQDEDGGEIEK